MANGVHDLGGTLGFVPVGYRPEEPVFADDWERLIFGIENVCLQTGLFDLHQLRYATESMEPLGYLTSTYYEHWMAAIETILTEKGLFSWDEIDERTRALMDKPRPLFERPGEEDRPRAPGPSDRIPLPTGRGGPEARFRPGDRVVARRDSPRAHTRLPRYARGNLGVVERVLDAFELPDRAAHDLGRTVERTYQVRFDASELWGSAAESGTAVYLDVWESYIELADPQEERTE